jgi:membrane fusion protein (multidrug efflux system)
MNHRALLLATASLAALAACGKPKAEEAAKPKAAPPVAVSVHTEPVRAAKMPRFLTLTGSVVADRSAEVAANVSGRVLEARVERGQRVKKGDVLIRVDGEAAGLSAAAATAQAGAAQTSVEYAERECKRTEALFAAQAITNVEYERQKTQCQSQLFSAEAARANAALATKVQNDANIRAPFDGVIGERYVNVGEYLQPVTRVVSLMSTEPARIVISVPEHAIGLVKMGQVLDVEVAAFPDKRFPATVKFVAPALRANSRDLLVEATATGAGEFLKPGMFATVRLSVGDEEQPTVAEGALRRDASSSRVFVVKEGAAVETVVRPGTRAEGRVAVPGSLAIGDDVILDPPASLKDGSPVTVTASN